MTRNWIAVNLVLLVVAALLGWKLHVSIKRFRADNDLAKLQPVQDLKQKITQEGGLPPLPPAKRYNPAEFAAIPDKNLFSETRAKEEKQDSPAVAEIPVLQVKPILVGVTLTSKKRLAAIIDPATAGTSRKAQPKRVGDTYQGYTITDISPTQMVLEYGSRREIIPLFDAAKHPPQAGKTAILPTRVVAFGGGSTGSAASGSAAPPAAVRNPPGASSVAQIGGSTAAGSTGAQSGVARAASQTGRQVPGNPQQAVPAQQQLNPGERVDDQGRRVIRTPFGDVVRPNTPNP
jgi:hypothetical protein